MSSKVKEKMMKETKVVIIDTFSRDAMADLVVDFFGGAPLSCDW